MVLRSVDFSTARAPGIRDAFYEVAIELRGERLVTGEHVVDFHRRVQVHLELAFAVDRGPETRQEYYRSRAVLVGLAAGEERTVCFYLPPEIVERDRLFNEPLGWRVALAVDGKALAQQAGSYSQTLRKPVNARRFLARIANDAPPNDGLLLPIYLTPFHSADSGRLSESPSYLRALPRLADPPPIRPPPDS